MPSQSSHPPLAPGVESSDSGKRRLNVLENIISEGFQTFMKVGRALKEIRDEKLYKEAGYETFAAYCQERWDISRKTGYQYIRTSSVVDAIEESMSASADNDLPLPEQEAHVRPLVSKNQEVQRKTWKRTLEKTEGDPKKVTQSLVSETLKEVEKEIEEDRLTSDVTPDERLQAPDLFDVLPRLTEEAVASSRFLVALPNHTIPAGLQDKAVPVGTPTSQYEQALPASVFDGRPPLEEIIEAYRATGRRFTFNDTNENVDWAAKTWNPITGCRHTCPYCYARYEADTLGRYKQGFRPTFFPLRLLAPEMTRPPKKITHIRDRNVFTCSMADLFGKWVPDWAIDAVLERASAHPEWNFLFLTKFPQKLSQFSFPPNAWVGTTVDEQSRVALAEKHFKEVDAAVKWLSCEPLLEALTFDSLDMFDGVVIGAQKGYPTIEDKQPKLAWVVDLIHQAQAAGCAIYWKENLRVPKDLPDGSRSQT